MFPHRHAMWRADCPTALACEGDTLSVPVMREFIRFALSFWAADSIRSHSGFGVELFICAGVLFDVDNVVNLWA